MMILILHLHALIQQISQFIKDSIGKYPDQPEPLKSMMDSEEKYIDLKKALKVKNYIIKNISKLGLFFYSYFNYLSFNNSSFSISIKASIIFFSITS